MRQFRIFAAESTRVIRGCADDQYGYTESEMQVKFESAIICDEAHVGGTGCTHAFNKCYYPERVQAGWDYEDDDIVLVIARYTDGDTFGTTHGYWEVEAACRNMKAARGYGEDNEVKIRAKHDHCFGEFERIEYVKVPFENLAVKGE